MNGLPRVVQRCARIGCLTALLLSVGGGAGDAHAESLDPSPAALLGARELFREATADVDAGRFGLALEKFKRVAAVKDTAPVRYNIGQCEERLGHIGAALAEYELAEREAAGDAKAAEVGSLARDRVAELRPRVPRLTLALAPDAPEGLAITLDGARVAPSSVGIALPVDPGHHTLEATLAGRAPFHKEIDLEERGTARVVVELGPPTPTSETKSPPAEASHARRTAGIVVASIGGALAITSVVLVALHNGAVSDLRRDLTTDCPPQGACPLDDTTHRQAAHASLRNTAVLDETMSIVFAAAAFAALGTGAYLIFAPPKKPSATGAWLSPTAPGAHAGLSLRATF